jgi:cytochrome P450
MMWTFDFLSRDQEWQDRVRADVAALPPAAEARCDLADCPLLDRAFSESIRLMPPLWLVDRKNAEEVTLGGHTIPAGTNIITSPYVTHRDPALWPQPLRFDPDRFLPEASAGRPKFAYFPFGGGRMKCIGILLAQLEMKAIARHVLRHVRLMGGPPAELESSFVLRTRSGLPVTVLPLSTRSAAAPAVATADYA